MQLLFFYKYCLTLFIYHVIMSTTKKLIKLFRKSLFNLNRRERHDVKIKPIENYGK